jgi:hypothetical protein
MPLPLTPLEDLPPARTLRLAAETGESRGFLAYPRAIAHFFDFCLVQGASLYSAKLFSVIFVSFHARAIADTGREALPLLREAYDFSSAQLFAASFAAFAVIYFIGFPLAIGRTPGLGLVGLRIRGDQGAPLTLRQLALRMIGCGFTYASFGALCVVGLRKRDGRFLQDLISGTRIVRE